MARLINDTHIFIHTAKTGGTFFREALNRFGIKNWEVGEKHDSLTTINENNPNLIAKVSFGFVRHPLTWYRSRWAYAVMTNFGNKLKSYPLDHPVHDHWMAAVWNNDLNKFVENCLRLMDGGNFREGIAFHYFNKMLGLENHINGNVNNNFPDGVDRVYRYENLVYATAQLFRTEFCIDTSIVEIQNIPKQLSSATIGCKITKELSNQLEEKEKRLIEMYY